jgi:hypothetical protein
MNCPSIRARITLFALSAALATAVPAFAGPPLLCHPFDIGTARSLPWSGAHAWWEGQLGYDIGGLVADTDALLVPSTPVVVRMETLRRAAIYASRDRRVAERLVSRLIGRARDSEASGHANALAFLDAAYVVGALRQIGMLDQMAEFRDRSAMAREVVAGADAYGLIQKSLAASPNDPSIEFAAALIAADSRRDAYLAHALKAREGAHRDALLARNISHVS